MSDLPGNWSQFEDHQKQRLEVRCLDRDCGWSMTFVGSARKEATAIQRKHYRDKHDQS